MILILISYFHQKGYDCLKYLKKNQPKMCLKHVTMMCNYLSTIKLNKPLPVAPAPRFVRLHPHSRDPSSSPGVRAPEWQSCDRPASIRPSHLSDWRAAALALARAGCCHCRCDRWSPWRSRGCRRCHRRGSLGWKCSR